MLSLESITIKFDKKAVISDLSFDFEDGKKYAIMGESGIGKSTLLNAIAGLVKLSGGRIISDHKKIGYVFQEPRLFPWLTAIENVKCVCNDQKKAEKILSLLLPDDFDKYPHELSGGMKQRVSIARAIAYDPDVFLIDEPFKALDEETKEKVSSVLMDLSKNKTVIMITHDRADLSLCDVALKLESSVEKTSLLELGK